MACTPQTSADGCERQCGAPARRWGCWLCTHPKSRQHSLRAAPGCRGAGPWHFWLSSLSMGRKNVSSQGTSPGRGTWQSGALRQLLQVGMLGLLSVGHEPV